MNETSEDWDGIEVTHEAALKELARHSVTAPEDVAAFEAEHGTGNHDGRVVLTWLGY